MKRTHLKQDLVHHTTELVQQLQALLLPHTGIIETGFLCFDDPTHRLLHQQNLRREKKAMMSLRTPSPKHF
ncbi:hypothetical protein JZ751_017330 [Albula glossodonta]|uniref:Uncharacterized protein n=1 Tax=Albula glossodonta TaxID=121402 RepID=A0A8T2PJL4_9TELE|nr:hypothetical protein JZ751_017330 [Albula glossodonta]